MLLTNEVNGHEATKTRASVAQVATKWKRWSVLKSSPCQEGNSDVSGIRDGSNHPRPSEGSLQEAATSILFATKTPYQEEEREHLLGTPSVLPHIT